MNKHYPAARNKPVKTIYLGFILLISCVSSNFTNADTILVHGDSLSAGYGMLPEETWVSLLAEKVTDQYEVINSSISGETSKGGLERLPALIETYKPDILIIELGANDGLRGYPINQMKDNLKAMIELGQQADAQVILLGIRIPPNFGKRYTEPFFNTFGELAKAFDLPYLPFMLEGVAQYADLMQADGLHPTKAAQPIILNNVLPLIEGLKLTL